MSLADQAQRMAKGSSLNIKEMIKIKDFWNAGKKGKQRNEQKQEQI